jgi:hypothetical protein
MERLARPTHSLELEMSGDHAHIIHQADSLNFTLTEEGPFSLEGTSFQPVYHFTLELQY